VRCKSAYSDAFESEGITLTGLFVPVGVLGATMPGVGPEHTRAAAHIGELAMFGGMIHDEGGGTVRRGLGREPLVTYRMSARDRARIPVLLRVMAETFLAAGAREVFLPVLGLRPLDADGLRRLDIARIPARRIECASQHPLGSAQMGATPEHSVVDADGRVWGSTALHRRRQHPAHQPGREPTGVDHERGDPGGVANARPAMDLGAWGLAARFVRAGCDRRFSGVGCAP
jgi:hypothetical protein